MNQDDQAYTNRELDEKFHRVEERFDEALEFLGRIEQKVDKTNGSVAAVKGHQKWLSGLTYGLGVCIVAIIIPVTGYFAIMAITDSAKIAALQALVHILTTK